MIHTLHINDNNLVVQSADALARSQGYAWIKDDGVIFDCNSQDSPIKNCRLAPQQINSRYWQQCEQSSIASNSAGMRHAADLVWRHLSELKTKHALDQVLLIVPSHYQAANLQLLLGIAKSCELQVVGVLNKAVAALHDGLTQTGEYLHIDVQLHQSVCTRIIDDGENISVGDVDVVQSVGIQAMQDAVLKAMQESFIQNDRFDPLHYAETEQQLFNQLDDAALQVQESGKATITVNHQDRLYRSSIDAKLWSTTLVPLFQPVLAQATAVVHAFIDLNSAFHNCVLSPLANNNFSVISAPPELDVAMFALAAASDEPIVYKTQLPKPLSASLSAPLSASLSKPAGSTSDKAISKDVLNSKPTSPARRISAVDANAATHLLQLGVAVPIDQAELRTQANQLSLHNGGAGNLQSLLDSKQVYVVNDESRHSIKPNDRLGSHLADGIVTVIRVV